jgi:hypothetical protein
VSAPHDERAAVRADLTETSAVEITQPQTEIRIQDVTCQPPEIGGR